MQPLHNVHPSKRHDRSNNSMHYDHDPSQIPFSQSAVPHQRTKHQYQGHHPHHHSSMQQYNTTPTKQQQQRQQQQQQSIRPHQHYYNDEHQHSSTSFTEAHSNLNNITSPLKSSQSIPSPIHLRNKSIRPSSKSLSSNKQSPSRYASSSSTTHRSNNPYGANSNGGIKRKQQNDPNLFTLHGILRIMKQKDQNYQMVTLGMDLTQLGGLDLNCPEPEIHHTFLSPWLDKWDDSNKYVTPSCYKLKSHNEHSPVKFMQRYKDQTLFYIFYAMVNDKMQMIAAKELYERHWVFHKSLRLWLREQSLGKESKKKKSKMDKKSKDNGMDKTDLFVQNIKVEQIEYFDVNSWKCEHFYTNFPVNWSIERERLLREGELNYLHDEGMNVL